MNDPRIHRINDIIKLVPSLRYDCNTGVFETDRRALYDFAELIIAECAEVGDSGDPLQDGGIGKMIKQHFGVE